MNSTDIGTVIDHLMGCYVIGFCFGYLIAAFKLLLTFVTSYK